ncbi:MAG: Flp family type IVb pilin [Marinomonas sp.]
MKKIGRDDSGATAIEYGLIASLVVIASIGAFDSVANENNGIWARVKNSVTDVM